MIGHKYNFDDVFLRNVTISLLDQLESKVKWINRFSSGDVIIDVPFEYSLTGDSRYLFDLFTDDIPSDVRKTELNADAIPRGVISLNSVSINSDELANPNVGIKTLHEVLTEDETGEQHMELKRLVTNVLSLPLRLSYGVEIYISSEIDYFKALQGIWNTLFPFNVFNTEYKYLMIDCRLEVPDDNEFIKNREIQPVSGSDGQLKLSFGLEVHTMYPSFLIPDLDTENQNSAKKTRWYVNLKKLNK